ncbi:hypothetical protein MCEL_00080 [Mycolicibacterium celeriflavum]|uniref:ChsH2 C-terminal OB-fold domain-containing protein n=1 Tax=Mycolicibacterium celeriflavum TaxID=1249101 RepID=A0A7I7RB76_MYCCF|nr:hypothetical protein MCEL_00080 [Mycolicibacterium celeriflavum]
MTRPLPELTVLNEFFWTAGADNVLRIQECRDCAALIHPAAGVPVLPQSQHGCARRVRQGHPVGQPPVRLPDLPPPYVVAQVAVIEDPRVRLTTNIVDCDPDDLELGQLVEVQFEKLEDVFLPVFRPSADKQTGPPEDEIAPQDFAKHVSTPLTTHRFEEHSAVGIGASRIGRRLMVPPLSLTMRGVADAGCPSTTSTDSPPIRAWTSRAWARAASPRSRARWESVRRGSTVAWTRSVRAGR